MATKFETFIAEELARVHAVIIREYRKEVAPRSSFHSEPEKWPSLELQHRSSNSSIDDAGLGRKISMESIESAGFSPVSTPTRERKSAWELANSTVSDVIQDPSSPHSNGNTSISLPPLPSPQSITPSVSFGGTKTITEVVVRQPVRSYSCGPFSNASDVDLQNLRRDAQNAVGRFGQDYMQSNSGASSPASCVSFSKSEHSFRTIQRAGTRKLLSGIALLDTPLDLHETWQELELQGDGIDDKLRIFRAGHEPGNVRRNSGQKTLGHSGSGVGTGFFESPSSKRCLRFVLDPSNPKRICWDACGVVMIGYDVIFIPLTTFSLEQTPFFAAMQWLSLLFWSMDIPMSFLVGFHDRGRLEMRPSQIARHYLRTFFFVDVMLVSLDVLVIALEINSQPGKAESDSAGFARVAKSYRMVRILRGLRLIRLVKLPQVFSHLCENIQSDAVLVGVGVAKLTVAMIAINHLIACLWFGLCSEDSLFDSRQSWVARQPSHKGTAYLYFTALHWSLSQFTPASMEVNPTSVHERIFVIVVILFAMVTFSTFISSITNAMNTWRMMNSEHAKSFSVLQRYFRSNHISLSLGVRVRRHIDYKLYITAQAVHEKDVKLLRMLNKPLQIDLHYEVYSVALKTHAFFVQFDQRFQRCMKMICHEAVVSLHVSEGDAIFCRGDPAKSFYTIKSGQTNYIDRQDQATVVKPAEWLAEAGLWTPWIHHGQVQAQGECTIVSLDTKTFLTCSLENRGVNAANVSHYAVLFVEHLNKLKAEDLSDLSDPRFNVSWATHVAFMKLGVPDPITEAGEEDEEDQTPDWRSRASWRKSLERVSFVSGKSSPPKVSPEDAGNAVVPLT